MYSAYRGNNVIKKMVPDLKRKRLLKRPRGRRK
jgi:hypothetical protein